MVRLQFHGSYNGWYKLYNTGWIEQGGYCDCTGTPWYISNVLIKLFCPMKDNKYTAFMTLGRPPLANENDVNPVRSSSDIMRLGVQHTLPLLIKHQLSFQHWQHLTLDFINIGKLRAMQIQPFLLN